MAAQISLMYHESLTAILSSFLSDTWSYQECMIGECDVKSYKKGKKLIVTLNIDATWKR